MFMTFGLSLVTTLIASTPDARYMHGKLIVDDAIAAVGGKENLLRFRSVSWSQVSFVVGEEVSYTSKHDFHWPSKFRAQQGRVTEVFDGDRYWVRTGHDVEERKKEDIPKDALSVLWIGTLVPFSEKSIKCQSLGDVVVGERKTAAVLVSQAGISKVKLYFDKTNKLLTKSEFQLRSPDSPAKELKCEIFYLDYRKIDGVKIAHRRIEKRNGDILGIVEINRMEVVDKFAAGTFDKPTD